MKENTGTRKSHDLILLAACYLFYGLLDIRGLTVLVAVSLFTYAGARMIFAKRQADDRSGSQKTLIIFISAQVIVLCFFKYSGIIPLPAGMSFYMLMAVSLLADIRSDMLSEMPSLTKTLIYISFFPTVLSGPITKARDFIPQIAARKKLTRDRLQKGAWLVVIGLFMKLCLADRLAVSVDSVYSAPAVFSGMTLFVASVSYSLELLFDFAGYSYIAIGVATILGFDIPANFNLPYMATNPSEFWNRWHISLSSWLREYVYIPLGGNRKGKMRTYINIMLVMIVSGLWHGSTVNFLLWGMLHGMGQMVHRAFSGIIKDAKPRRVFRIFSMILNFLFVNFLWIPFRAETLHDTWTIIRRILTLAEGASYYYVYTFIFGAILLVIQYIGAVYNNGDDPVKPLPLDKMYAKVIFCMLIIMTAMFAYFGSGAFIYSKF